ncbi:MAG: hypothetical protein JSW56_02130, partial [Deltaproteobacteria bacterium]
RENTPLRQPPPPRLWRLKGYGGASEKEKACHPLAALRAFGWVFYRYVLVVESSLRSISRGDIY